MVLGALNNDTWRNLVLFAKWKVPGVPQKSCDDSLAPPIKPHVRGRLQDGHRLRPSLFTRRICHSQEGTGSVWFVSAPDFSKINRFGSVRFGQLFVPVRCGSACVFRTWHGSVRFGSVRFRVRFRVRFPPIPEFNVLFDSVRFGFLFLPDKIKKQNIIVSSQK